MGSEGKGRLGMLEIRNFGDWVLVDMMWFDWLGWVLFPG